MSRRSEADYLAKGVLPWRTLSLFRNVLSGMSANVNDEVIELLNPDIYVGLNGVVYVPGASMFVVIRNPMYDVEELKGAGAGGSEGAKLMKVVPVNGVAWGRLPNGAGFAVDLTKINMDDVTFEASGKVDEFSIKLAASEAARIKAGGPLGGALRNLLKKAGVGVIPTEYTTTKVILVVSHNVVGRINLNLRLYTFTYGDSEFSAASLAAGAIEVLRRGGRIVVAGKYSEDAQQEAYDKVDEFIKESSEVGRRLMPLVPVVQGIKRSTFTYMIGDIVTDESSDVAGFKEMLRRNYGVEEVKYVKLGRATVGKGVTAEFSADLERMKLSATLSFYPPSTPATIVLNYPPYPLAPLAAAVNDGWAKLAAAASDAARRFNAMAKVFRLSAANHLDSLRSLADADVGLKDVRNLFSQGYPSIESFRDLLDKLDRLSDIAEIVSMAIVPPSKLSKVLINVSAGTTKGVGRADYEHRTRGGSGSGDEEEGSVKL